jgi:hypothetical protein
MVREGKQRAMKSLRSLEPEPEPPGPGPPDPGPPGPLPQPPGVPAPFERSHDLRAFSSAAAPIEDLIDTTTDSKVFNRQNNFYCSKCKFKWQEGDDGFCSKCKVGVLVVS